MPLSFCYYRIRNILVWSGKRGSNSRPLPWQGSALSTELFPQLHTKAINIIAKFAVIVNSNLQIWCLSFSHVLLYSHLCYLVLIFKKNYIVLIFVSYNHRFPFFRSVYYIPCLFVLLTPLSRIPLQFLLPLLFLLVLPSN